MLKRDFFKNKKDVVIVKSFLLLKFSFRLNIDKIEIWSRYLQ